MKALSLAAGLAIALAGTACSEQVPAEPENVSAETAAPAAVETPAANTSSRSRFNLRWNSAGPAAADIRRLQSPHARCARVHQ